MKRNLAAMAALTAVALTLSGCATGAVNNVGVQTESTRSMESRTLQANTYDLQFIDQMRPLLQDTVEMGEQLLISGGIDDEVRELAQTSMNREQDEIIQLNSLLEQWQTIGESTEGGDGPLPETGTVALVPSAELTGVPEAERTQVYLTTLRERLERMISLAESEVEQGESQNLKDQAELMIKVKRERIHQIDELLATSR